jgi:protein involved in polysaccharide export with SLBB domain
MVNGSAETSRGARIGGAMTLGMQRQMTRATAAFAALLCGAALGCGHRSATNPAQIAALQPPTPLPPGPGYRIQIGDELHVRFMYQPDQNEQMPVRPDGRISLVSTGELEVVGLTPTDLEKLIVDKASSHLRNPEVTVIVTKLGERRVYVGGEVERPGYVLIQPDMTPLQAVMQSGGFKPTAKLDSVLLITPTPDGRFSAARVDMRQVVEDGVPERLRLHTNDVVFVPRTWIADMDIAVDQYVRGLFPALPRVGAGYSLSQ